MKKYVYTLTFTVFCLINNFHLQAQLLEQWHCKFANTAAATLDSNNTFYTSNIVTDEAGNTYTVAYGNSSYSLLKFNNLGLMVWRRDSLPVYAYNFNGIYGTSNYQYTLQYHAGSVYFMDDTSVIKFNSNGDIVWRWGFTDPLHGERRWTQMNVDNSQSVIISGQGNWLPAGSPYALAQSQLLAKIDSNGRVLWSDSIENNNITDSVLAIDSYNIITDSAGNIYYSYTIGSAFSSYPGTAYLRKYRPDGIIAWTVQQSNSNVGGSVFRPQFQSNGDLCLFLEIGNVNYVYVYSSDGVFQRSTTIGSLADGIAVGAYSYNLLYQAPGYSFVKLNTDLTTATSHHVAAFDCSELFYHNGYFYVTAMGDPQDSLILLTQYDLNCNVVNNVQILYTGLNIYSGNVKPYITFDNYDNIYLLISVSGDSVELLKFCPHCKPNITGRVYNDLNRNCAIDSNETGSSLAMVQLTPGPYYTFTDSNGIFSMLVPSGNYNLNYTLQPYQNVTCTDTISILLDSDNTVSSNNLFGIYLMDTVSDMQINLWCSRAVFGYPQDLYINYSNAGSTTDSGYVQLNTDGTFGLSWSIPAPDSISAHSFFWKYSNLSPGQSGVIQLQDTLVQSLTGLYQYSCFISPIINDVNPRNNYDTINGAIFSSFDPNGKICTVKNLNVSGNLTDSSILIYTVNFQNTGTDTARRIVVVDTLSPNVDITTFKMLQTGIENYSLNFVAQNVIEWTFDNAMLPDSYSNMALSQSFIKYQIETKQDVVAGTAILNSATIYFDFNAGVTTNTTVNYFESAPTGISSLSAFGQTVIIYPNPLNSTAKIMLSNSTGLPTVIEVYDISGKLVSSDSFADDKAMFINRGSLSAGLYMAELKQKGTKVAVVKVAVQ